ncbi:putative bifunctional diguanylate cyclase/phosphodiesterase [Paractinoplanes brasiliensis]|uniref:PAS domain S-box-containing protein/diguanylate cyclase (GGDEF)-like protein n=1 Tax=Paractinoplanes brasiliensis TaxID=52695 RepID=A0A4R6JJT6_9ACTN|nr:GGDEF domain-containing phosphodiesterase [Actinoplanes brasiliensis]TDO36460.1 PAS domain S-box-containing protein/diguanylate cyclase (GGDEF)-like protein [Actinoplanes brasiliensis]GID32513.1 hypothetical protein Abr02nite_74960 [Actinoplanes brasiliensis]
MTSRTAYACYAGWVVVVAAAYYAFPEAHLYTWAALGYSSAAAIVAGVRLNRPSRQLPWYLIALAIVCFTTGDSLYNLILARGHQPPYPGVNDALYLLVYPLLTVGFLYFVRARSGGGNRTALLDALVPTVGFGLLAWIYWIAPFTRSEELSMLQKLASIAYPVGDVLALAMMLRIITTSGRRPGALTAIGTGIVGLLLSDVFYGQSQLNSAWVLGGPVDLGWIVFYAAVGFAGLLPSMRELTEPSPSSGADSSPRRIIWMASAALIAPVVLLLQWAQGLDDDELGPLTTDLPVIAAASALMFVLVLARVNGLANVNRRARDRELALREAGALLSSAATEQDAVQSVRQAVATLMPASQPCHVRLLESVGLPPGRGVRVAPVADVPELPVPPEYDHVAYATMELPGENPRVVTVLVAAPLFVLRELRPSFEALFDQVAVVLERINLTGEVSRRDTEAYFRTLIHNASDVILIVDDEDRIRYASPSAAGVFGYPDLTGMPLATLTDQPVALGRILAGIRAGRPLDLDGLDVTAVCADGRSLHVDFTARDLRDDPTVRGLVLTIRDMTDRYVLEKDLYQLAFYDELTGMANRVLFRDRLEQAYGEAQRDDAELAVLFVDVDDFKEVNDTLGHAVGDELLVIVAKRITEAVGTGRTAARLGADEFAVLAERITDASEAEELAARIVAALAAPVEVSDGSGRTHIVSGACSVGVASSRDAHSGPELLRHADLALHQAKGADKGTWQRYRGELHTDMAQRLETRVALLDAIDAEQFRLLYQPIVNLRTNRVEGVEALVRWQHPTRGLLGPYHFIELAEESGAIVAIGNWVLRESLAQFARWHADDPSGSPSYVSVNVSARQFRTPGFVDRVRAALTEAGVEPPRLLLEITESLVLRDADQVWADLRTLRALGVRMAIDDFGTGYSSLSYLREMPVDVLKIDKSFIDDVLHSEKQRVLVETIVALAHNFELRVVAEGIEDHGQRAVLTAMGCDYGQGYLFAKPVRPEEIPALTRVEPALVK